MTDKTTDMLAEMRARVDAATEGPWDIQGRSLDPDICEVLLPDGEDDTMSLTWHIAHGITGMQRPNAEFIAASRTDMPRLLDAVEAVLAVHVQRLMQLVDESGEPLGDKYPVGCACWSDESPCPTVEAITRALGVSE